MTPLFYNSDLISFQIYGSGNERKTTFSLIAELFIKGPKKGLVRFKAVNICFYQNDWQRKNRIV